MTKGYDDATKVFSTDGKWAATWYVAHTRSEENEFDVDYEIKVWKTSSKEEVLRIKRSHGPAHVLGSTGGATITSLGFEGDELVIGYSNGFDERVPIADWRYESVVFKELRNVLISLGEKANHDTSCTDHEGVNQFIVDELVSFWLERLLIPLLDRAGLEDMGVLARRIASDVDGERRYQLASEMSVALKKVSDERLMEIKELLEVDVAKVVSNVPALYHPPATIFNFVQNMNIQLLEILSGSTTKDWRKKSLQDLVDKYGELALRAERMVDRELYVLRKEHLSMAQVLYFKGVEEPFGEMSEKKLKKLLKKLSKKLKKEYRSELNDVLRLVPKSGNEEVIVQPYWDGDLRDIIIKGKGERVRDELSNLMDR